MDKVKETLNKVPLSGYIVLVIAIAIFSGLFANAGHGLNIFDFDTLNGKFGTMKSAKATFSGQGGSGARDGFLFAFGLAPGVMLAMGLIEVVEHYGGLKAAQKLMTPILRPILGIPVSAVSRSFLHCKALTPAQV